MRKILATAAVTLALSACTATAPAEPFVRVTDEAEFRALVVDRSLSNDAGSFTIASDGTVGGRLSGRDFSGTWDWQDGHWCREIAISPWPTDCQTVERQGSTLRFTRQKGTGEVGIYRVAG